MAIYAKSVKSPVEAGLFAANTTSPRCQLAVVITGDEGRLPLPPLAAICTRDEGQLPVKVQHRNRYMKLAGLTRDFVRVRYV
jgi:hypothetical protein